MKYACALAALVTTAGLASASETIGPWNIGATPVNATGSVAANAWLNVANAPVSVFDAFTGFSILDDGMANLPTGTVIDLTWAAGTAVNNAGSDLVLFDARFSHNSYQVYVDFDGFTTPFAISAADLAFTGEMRSYFYGAGGAGAFPADIMAAPIDLAFWGVPLGGQVTTVRVVTTNSEADFIGMGSLVPAPGALALLSVAGLMTRRRR